MIKPFLLERRTEKVAGLLVTLMRSPALWEKPSATFVIMKLITRKPNIFAKIDTFELC